jgi:hypothetical protein
MLSEYFNVLRSGRETVEELNNLMDKYILRNGFLVGAYSSHGLVPNVTPFGIKLCDAMLKLRKPVTRGAAADLTLYKFALLTRQEKIDTVGAVTTEELNLIICKSHQLAVHSSF